ncbi:unnamed protein product [Brachionus calyciflorus]|uniref:Uncharacterized protein n=1 Tax=Brachionus calyciflorus TaxID=104777 RepID=A0A813Q6C8_9BILA|nr:unnamed protein product [Brachionus calyciflorus]
MKGSEHTNMIYAFSENRNSNSDRIIDRQRLMNSYDLMANKLSKSKNFLLEKIKSSSANGFEKLGPNYKTKSQSQNKKNIPKKLNIIGYEHNQEPEFAKISYRLKNIQYFEDRTENGNNASDFQKRDKINDSSYKIRDQSRNKSAINDLFIAPASKMANSNSQNQSSRNTVQKNYIDLNLQGPLYNSNSNFFNQTANYQMISLYQPTRVQSSKTSHHNLKIINDSNKFLEDVLAHSKRKSVNLNQFSNSSNHSFNLNNSNQQIQYQNNLVINRTQEERNMFPDKLIMDRRKLNFCPKIEGEDTLKLINYQHNQIRSIQNLDTMRNLIFLDLYDNRIEKITGLSNLINLRVLMLGKNRIQKIENLENLVFLDILDLHGNLITKIENLNNLKELRVLNIAANEIQVVENLSGLSSIVELNLRRNKIEEINSLETLLKLQRFFLSHNQISSIAWLKTISPSLQELTLDNNPIFNESNYRLSVLSLVNLLRKLDLKRVTDNERRMAYNIYTREISKNSEFDTQSRISAKIQDAENDWIMKNQSEKASSFVRQFSNSDLIDNNDENDYENVSFSNNRIDKKQNNLINSSYLNSSCSSQNSFKDYISRNEMNYNDPRVLSASSIALKKNISNSTLNGQKPLKPTQNNCSTVQQDSTMLFYGTKSLEILDVKLDQNVQNQITTLSFHFIDYDECLARNFLKLKNKFPNTLNLIFTCCNIKNLNQLYSLLEWKRLDSVTINKDDNPIESISFWKFFVNNYLNILQVKKINNSIIALSDPSQKIFNPLSSLLFKLPDHKLMCLVKKERKKINQPKDEDEFKNEINNNFSREQMFKSFGSNCQVEYNRMLLLENQSKSTSDFIDNNLNGKLSSKAFSQSFVNMLLKQMNHNDSRKKKLNQIKSQLWTSLVEESIQRVFDSKSHVRTLCEQYKIIL